MLGSDEESPEEYIEFSLDDSSEDDMGPRTIPDRKQKETDRTDCDVAILSSSEDDMTVLRDGERRDGDQTAWDGTDRERLDGDGIGLYFS